MIITQKVLSDVGGRNQAHYESLGYILPKEPDNRGRLRVPKGTKMEVSVYDLPKSSQVKIKYSCDNCGNVNEVDASTLFWRENSQYKKTGETLCSKCANGRMSGINSGQYKHGNNRFCEYRSNAKRRGKSFELSVEEFESITSQPCHYCGGTSSDYDKSSRGNGIDRMDSRVGYIFENCVPCCSRCNFVKNTLGYDEFLEWIRKIYNRRVG